MDYKELKMLMRGKARLARGLVNLLKDDTEQIYNDVNVFDVISLEEAIRDTKRTTQQLLDATIDLEYYLMLAKQDTIDIDA
jgi:hypothetical protein